MLNKERQGSIANAHVGGSTSKKKAATKKQKKFPVHKIRSFDDLDKILTEENCDMIMGNFYGVVKCFLQVKKKHPELKLSGFDWIDDGKLEIREANVTVSQRFKMSIETKK
ncbi:hypothetical protein [uncultured Flavobacterium sp.]|uniref:hypothetical protein n=1 Tax=uncultured Flavobacterium sp. TaxID=165435 RepID=UPI00259A88A1|nr:hypothetical protein [uncultured Flavobacterium sp.]